MSGQQAIVGRIPSFEALPSPQSGISPLLCGGASRQVTDAEPATQLVEHGTDRGRGSRLRDDGSRDGSSGFGQTLPRWRREPPLSLNSRRASATAKDLRI